MKKILLVFAFCLPLFVFGQSTEKRNLDKFSEVSVSQSIKLTLVKGNKNQAVVSTEGELEKVITEVDGDRLIVKIENKNNWYNNSNDKVEVEVTYTEELTELKSSSSSTLTVEGVIESNSLAAKASSSSSMYFTAKVNSADIAASSSASIKASVQANELEAQVSSSATIKLSGSANSFEASASSSGDIKGKDFVANSASLKSSSSGSIYAEVKDELTASASSSGSVYYGGSPKLRNTNTSSGGRIKTLD